MAESAHPELNAWVKANVEHCAPDRVHWCDGSAAEFDALTALMVNAGMAVRLSETKRPGSFLFRSSPGDVARVENRTYICSEHVGDAGPTNNWADPGEMRATLKGLFKDCMRGRTMYVVPYSMGPVGSPIAGIGVELTDSPYVVCNMHLMTRVGAPVLKVLGHDGTFVRGLHSVGQPLKGPLQPDSPWPCDAENKYICHFPDSREIASYGRCCSRAAPARWLPRTTPCAD